MMYSVSAFLGESQKCYISGLLDRRGHGSLVMGTRSSESSRKDFPTLRQKRMESCLILVIDEDMVSTEATYLFSLKRTSRTCHSYFLS